MACGAAAGPALRAAARRGRHGAGATRRWSGGSGHEGEGGSVKVRGAASRENASPSASKGGMRRAGSGEGNGTGSPAGCPGRAAPPGSPQAAAAVPPRCEGSTGRSAEPRGPR